MTADWLLLALAFPAVLINVGHGHNGFLTAALLGGGLVILDRRPLLAGILFGLMAYKPQFGLMIPIALAAGGYWRTFAAAAATAVLLTLVTTLVFGVQVWHAFFVGAEFTRTVVLEQGDTGWHKIQSIFSWARMWGAPVPLAYAIQGAATLVFAMASAWLWHGKAPYPLKAAGLCLAAILATPYTLDYDMMVLAPAIAFLAADGMARGFGPWEKTALAALWLVPLVARTVPQADPDPARRAGDAGDVCFDPAARGIGSCAAAALLRRLHQTISSRVNQNKRVNRVYSSLGVGACYSFEIRPFSNLWVRSSRLSPDVRERTSCKLASH